MRENIVTDRAVCDVCGAVEQLTRPQAEVEGNPAMLLTLYREIHYGYRRGNSTAIWTGDLCAACDAKVESRLRNSVEAIVGGIKDESLPAENVMQVEPTPEMLRGMIVPDGFVVFDGGGGGAGGEGRMSVVVGEDEIPF